MGPVARYVRTRYKIKLSSLPVFGLSPRSTTPNAVDVHVHLLAGLFIASTSPNLHGETKSALQIISPRFPPETGRLPFPDNARLLGHKQTIRIRPCKCDVL